MIHERSATNAELGQAQQAGRASGLARLLVESRPRDIDRTMQQQTKGVEL